MRSERVRSQALGLASTSAGDAGAGAAGAGAGVGASALRRVFALPLVALAAIAAWRRIFRRS
jgi:hypothetical protein